MPWITSSEDVSFVDNIIHNIGVIVSNYAETVFCLPIILDWKTKIGEYVAMTKLTYCNRILTKFK